MQHGNPPDFLLISYGKAREKFIIANMLQQSEAGEDGVYNTSECICRILTFLVSVNDVPLISLCIIFYNSAKKQKVKVSNAPL